MSSGSSTASRWLIGKCGAGGATVSGQSPINHLVRSQPELARDRTQRGDTESDVLVEIDTEPFGTCDDLVPVDAGRKGRLAKLLANRLRLERLDAVGPDITTRADEPRQLVAGEERLLQRRLPHGVEMLGVAQDRLHQLLRVALVAEDRCPILRMLVERGMNLVIEVVKKRGRAPEGLVLSELDGVGAHARLHGKRMATERLALRVAGQRLPGLLAVDLHRVG